jgi:hypothetical protein
MCRDVGLPRLTPSQRGLAPSHPVAVRACPVSPRRSVGLPRLTPLQCGLAPSQRGQVSTEKNG